MESTTIEIINKLGLHARAASKFASTASRFGCSIQVSKNGEKTVDGKSIMSLMLLAAAKGSELKICCDGDDALDALNALCELISDRFGEDE
ncbi:MAG: HPr family phosphocarrier protein [Pseudomonadales bacterium]|nr:HPr family phosphocarrier protein [Pseudomonadales bacterium]